LHIVLNLALYSRTGKDAFWRPVWRVRRSIVAAAAMVGALFALRFSGADASWSRIAQVAAEISLGAFAYFASHLLLWTLERRPDGVEAMIAALATPALSKVARGTR
jgi:hypothetical protein